jgi:hypothetical protein
MNDMRKGTCPLCNHNEILEAKPADVVGGHQVRNTKKVPPGAQGWVLMGSNSNDHYGPLTVYVCRSCGFAQWFAGDPGEIPASDYFQTRVIKGPETEGPFR